jgi:hypothetical protein
MRPIRLALFLTFLITTKAFGAADDNAAVKYLRANVALRQAYALEPDAAPELEKALQSPLDQSDEKLIAAASEALTEFQHASALGTCDWELSISDGPGASTSHRGAIRELVAVAGIRARLRFRDGHTKEGLEDWLAADAAARQLSTDGTIASLLISYKLENEISDVLEPELGKFSRSELDFLADGARRMPLGMTMQSAFAREKLDRDDLASVAAAANTREDAVKSLTSGVPVLGGNENKAREIIDSCGGSGEGLRICIRKQSEFYARWNSRWSEPPAQFEADYNAEFLTASRSNAILARFTPSLSRLRWAEAYSQTRRMLLRAAIAVERNGAGVLNSFPDPSTGEPFTYLPQGGGFRLQSQIKENGMPLSITVAGGSGHRRQ